MIRCGGVSRLGLAAGLLVAAPLFAADPPAGDAPPASPALPVRGLHLFAPAKKDLAAALAFIREALPKEGVNTLVLEINYGFSFQSRPELADPSALDKDDVRQIVMACREANVVLIPQVNCLGHQSWAGQNGRFLQKHPELDETPNKAYKRGAKPDDPAFFSYCRSYCPLYPDVHKVLFPLLSELAAAFEAKAFHVGMDEVFCLADPDCPRCKGKDPAELFAGEVKALHGHLKSIGCRTWMWGDRLLDGKATRIGSWEAATNGTQAAIDAIPKDIVICDWHYEKAHETPRVFAEKGFEVVACPWRKPEVALGQLSHIRAVRADADKAVAARALGMVHTTWVGFAPFLKEYKALEAGGQPGKGEAPETARCFRELFKAMREQR
jgi:hypothetical protein